MDTVGYYTVELARPPHGWGRVERLTDRAREAADECSRHGARVRHLRSIFVPERDACFLLYEGATADAVRDAAERAGLEVEQVHASLGAGETGP
ncbi:MAG TPA: nickel-binding protein [Gaiellaceae bacterium]|nr:nickel-binding protein [Gaiellaceae bacterium]